MDDLTDQQLLRDYAERQSEAAFAAIVQRYIDLVYSAAFRMICDAQVAKDVTQSVFVALAQNARQLTDRTALAGWLHCTARNLAAKAVRSEVRRRDREQEAAIMHELLSASPDVNWEHIAPHLDDALGELREPDRDAVLLRYFKNHDLRTVGATLGISDDAAQKRVSRAVERLREFFAKRGVTVGAGGLAVVISANAVQAAPVGLAVAISTAAVLTGTTLATTATVTATKAIAMTALQKTLVTATIAVLAGAGIYEARQASQLRDQVQTLEKRQADLTEKFQAESEEKRRQLAVLREENERTKRDADADELLRLRGQISLLRRQVEELKPNTLLQVPTRQDVRLVKQGAAEPQMVTKLVITPIKHLQLISEDQIRTNISIKAGANFDQAMVDSDVKNLYGIGAFRKVRVVESNTDDGIALNYLVEEKPTLTTINFLGNTKFHEDELRKILVSKVGGFLDERIISSDSQKIQENYTQWGFKDAKVKYTLSENEDLGVGGVTFKITD